MARVHATFVGCKVSQADSEAALRALTASGHIVERDAGGADLHVVVTCGVTAEAERKSRQLVHRLAAGGRPVMVAGCAATLRPEQFAAAGVHVVGGGESNGRFAALVERAAAIAGDPSPGPEPTTTAAARTRFTLKVQDGCTARCTYCVVRLARGRAWSLALEDAIAAAAAALDAGCGEVVVSGVNLGAYRDAGGNDLAALVSRLVELPRLARLRLSSVGPGHLTAGLLDALAHGKVARHLHVPLQSADDGVLAAMARPYTLAGYTIAAERAREHVPGLALTTDVIVGFPAEDEEAFARTLAAIGPEAGLFGRVHVFRFSSRPGTAAQALGRLPAGIVKERVRRACEAAAASQATAASAWIGQSAKVLVEEYRDGLWRGYSSQYVRYYLAGEAEAGRLVTAVADDTYRDGVKGRVT